MTQTVIEHLLRRLKSLGREDIFGYPGATTPLKLRK